MKKTKWTPLFLLLAAAALAVTPTAGFLAVITFIMTGIFLVLAAVSLLTKSIHSEGRTRRNWHFFLVAGLLLAAAALFGFLRYRPALMAAPGYTLHNITKPGWLNDRIKTVQAIFEQTPCTYTLLGWQEEQNLYYESVCAGKSQVWRYAVSVGQSEKTGTAPVGLYEETVPAAEVTNGVLADVYPRELSTVSREVFIVGDAFPSPDGRFAALISRHVYGPQDVLLLTPAP